MSIHYLCMPVAAAITLSTMPSHAGPCLPEIDRMQARVDAMIAATAADGPAGRESTAALTHRQPTPSSIAAAEAKLREGAPAETLRAVIVFLHATFEVALRSYQPNDDKRLTFSGISDLDKALT